MTDYEMICQESKNLSTEEQARVLQYIQSTQNEKGGGKRKSRSIARVAEEIPLSDSDTSAESSVFVARTAAERYGQ